ncbi:hypothetical protein D3C78_1160280 [compost metagenome]
MPKNLLSLLWLLLWDVSCKPSMVSEPCSLMTLASVPPRAWLPLMRTLAARTISLPSALTLLPWFSVLPWSPSAFLPKKPPPTRSPE